MMFYPKSRSEWLALRHQYISSTEVSALFGMSPYMTAFELAVMKKADLPDDREAGERAEWGIRLQHAIAKGIGERYGVKVRAMSGYATSGFVHTRMGASFDYEIVGLLDDKEYEPNDLRSLYATHGPGVLEIKNVDSLVFRNEWTDDESFEAPAHIELQVQHQLACCARKWAAIGVLIGGNRLELITRERDTDVHQVLQAKCWDFWKGLEKGEMPPVELPADAAIIGKLYRYAEPGKVLDAQDNEEITTLVRAYNEAGKAKKVAEDAQKSAKAELLMKIGAAERVLVKGYNFSASTVAPVEIAAHTREGYRGVRITVKKDAK